MNNEIHSGHIHDMTDALHKDDLDDIPGFGPVLIHKNSCDGCIVKKYPACDLGIPCCQCKDDSCNSRQPCPKKGGN